MSLYSVRKTTKGHRITKFDDLFFVLASYEVVDGSCDCPARWGCKHPSMVKGFELAGKIDTGAFWDSETEQWEEPLVKVEAPILRRLT